MADFGLMFYNARWYDPALGRFTSADSVVPGGVQGYDRYAYANNSPVVYVDPSGHAVGLPPQQPPCEDSMPGCGNSGGGGGGGASNNGDVQIATAMFNACHSFACAHYVHNAYFASFSSWEMIILVNLTNTDPEGTNAAQYLYANGVDFDHLTYQPTMTGAAWTLDGSIAFPSNSSPWPWSNTRSLPSPYDPFVVGSVAHEAYHLEQGPLWALSKLGEVEAWRIGFIVKSDFSHTPLDGIEYTIANWDMDKIYGDPAYLQAAISDIHVYNIMAQAPLYNLTFDRLPTYPVSWNWIYAGN